MFMKEFGILSSGVKVKFKTTGSTGKPKDILHTKESLQHAIDRNIKLLDLKESDVVLNFIPRHTIGVYIMAVPLEQVGGKVFDESVQAVNRDHAIDTAKARNPHAKVIGVNPIVGTKTT